MNLVRETLAANMTDRP